MPVTAVRENKIAAHDTNRERWEWWEFKGSYYTDTDPRHEGTTQRLVDWGDMFGDLHSTTAFDNCLFGRMAAFRPSTAEQSGYDAGIDDGDLCVRFLLDETGADRVHVTVARTPLPDKVEDAIAWLRMMAAMLPDNRADARAAAQRVIDEENHGDTDNNT